MSAEDSLLERLKQARIVRVLLVYLGASWVALQMVDTLVGLLALPEWVGPVAVVLLVVGLFVVLATAWVQSLPSTTAAEKAGDLPSDWEIAPLDLLAELRAGRIPHLTWGRAMMGGVMAISLLFGAAGVYVLTTGGRGLIGPVAAGASVAPNAVAILPFETRGADVEVWEEGMVDVLTTNLEGLGGLRTINSGTVVARWESEIGGTATAELEDALRVAGGLHARYAVRGSVFDAGGEVRISAEVFDLADGSRVDGAQVGGGADGMLELVDALTVQLATVFVGGRGASSRSHAIETGSVEALETYLRGEALFRELRFEEAIEAYREATAADSTFALAWWREAEAWGWLVPSSEEGNAALARAEALADGLPPREQLLVRVAQERALGSKASVPALRRHLERHPDDADAWIALAEHAAHTPWLSMSPAGELELALTRAVALVPSFSPNYIHLLGLMLAEGRDADFHRYLDVVRATNPQDAFLPAWEPVWRFYWGTAEERAEAESRLRTFPETERGVVSMGILQGDGAERAYAAQVVLTAGFIDQAFPFMSSGLATAAGLPPEEWPVRQAPGLMRWALLTGDSEAYRDELAGVLGNDPTIDEAVSLALLAAASGEDALSEAALAALPDTAWSAPYGHFGGATSAADARRSAEALGHIRDGDPQGAVGLLEATLRRDTYDALAVYLMGRAQADLGDWDEALRYWEVLLRTVYRPHVRLGMARVYEAKGDTAAALEGYRGFLTMWEEADPSLPPKVEATEAVARLGG